MERCRHCGSERIIKTGHRDGQQKWRCKDCKKFQGAQDRREKYSAKERKMALTLSIVILCSSLEFEVLCIVYVLTKTSQTESPI